MDAGRALRSSWPGDCSEWQHSKRLKSLPAAWNPQSCQYSLQGVWQAKRSDASDVSVVERTSAEDGWSFAWPIHLSSFISLKCSSTNTQLCGTVILSRLQPGDKDRAQARPWAVCKLERAGLSPISALPNYDTENTAALHLQAETAKE